MRAIEPMSLRFGADHLTRQPVPYLEAAGFTVDEVHRRGPGGTTFRVLAHEPDRSAFVPGVTVSDLEEPPGPPAASG